MPRSKSATNSTGRIFVPSFCSPGTILDRVSILRMKAANFRNATKLYTVQYELELLASIWAEMGYPPWYDVAGYTDIADINGWLWELENRARLHEVNGDFGARFRATIRTIHHLNSYRASLRASLDAYFVGQDYPKIVEIAVGVDAYLDGVAILAVMAKRAASEDQKKSALLQKSSWLTLWTKLGFPDDAFDTPDFAMLTLANERIWDTKDALVEAEAVKHFDDAYVRTGRSLYIANDRRVQLKKRVALTYNSGVWDEKEYVRYPMPEDWDDDQLTWKGFS